MKKNLILFFVLCFNQSFAIINGQLFQDTSSSDSSFIGQVLGIFEEEEGRNIIELQRSKRKQVDELLKAILEQPGVLRFSGVATASVQTTLNSKSPYYGIGSFDIFALTSLGENTLLFFDFEAIGGYGPIFSG